ncbi:hypothetical protein SIN09_15200 [Streptomyces sp. F8]|uniref:hypothetical protein n=1 Tax=Streptomyces sp. F8 TaxID=1436085 RepID=UPI0029CB9108|nr:hypothetical protein [Streptomyces sp. F8]MDX6760748.1 hypothetical protein [Streptomyces sp. F8]
MASVIADHPPQELAAELSALLRVDWRAVWPGIPDGEAERAEWCAAFGWEPLWLQSGLWVRTPQGGRLHLASAPGPGRPVTRASYTVWKATAAEESEGEAVLAVALDRYAAHLARMTAALGDPGRWGDAEKRGLESGAPYRMAQWRYANPLAPVIVLDLDHRADGYAGGGTISLAFHGPADPNPDNGPGWLL